MKYEVKMIDTHAHLLMLEDMQDIIENMPKDDMDYIVTIGTTLEDSIQSLELAKKYENVYATVGIFPEYSKTTTDRDLNEIEELAKHEKIVAIGEIGLDYHYDYDKESQKEMFVRQLEIADRLGIPFCIHCFASLPSACS